MIMYTVTVSKGMFTILGSPSLPMWSSEWLGMVWGPPLTPGWAPCILHSSAPISCLMNHIDNPIIINGWLHPTWLLQIKLTYDNHIYIYYCSLSYVIRWTWNDDRIEWLTKFATWKKLHPGAERLRWHILWPLMSRGSETLGTPSLPVQYTY